jgi:hypothetical protein
MAACNAATASAAHGAAHTHPTGTNNTTNAHATAAHRGKVAANSGASDG